MEFFETRKKKSHTSFNFEISLLFLSVILLLSVNSFAGKNIPLKCQKTAHTPVTSWESFRANLYIVYPDTAIMADGILVDYYETFSNAVDYDDAPKINNGNENVSLKRDGTLLMIERRFTMANNDTLYLNLTGMRSQSYRWIFSGISIAETGRVAWVIDNYTGLTTVINLAGNTVIDFTVTGTSASYATNRFKIVFQTINVLPVTFTMPSRIILLMAGVMMSTSRAATRPPPFFGSKV